MQDITASAPEARFHIHLSADISFFSASKVDHHFPTLLHFAAFHNLRELCNALLEMPGAVAAFHKKNIDDKDPLDLAEEREHEDLVDYFMAFLVRSKRCSDKLHFASDKRG